MSGLVDGSIEGAGGVGSGIGSGAASCIDFIGAAFGIAFFLGFAFFLTVLFAFFFAPFFVFRLTGNQSHRPICRTCNGNKAWLRFWGPITQSNQFQISLLGNLAAISFQE